MNNEHLFELFSILGEKLDLTQEDLANTLLRAVDNNNVTLIQDQIKTLEDKNPLVLKSEFGTKWTLMHYAAYMGNLEVIKVLAQVLPDKNPKIMSKGKENGRIPIHYAAQEGHAEIVVYLSKFLTKNKDPSDSEGYTPLQLAAENGHLDVVKFLLAHVDDKLPRLSADGKISGRTPVHFAAQNGHLEVVKLFELEEIETLNPPDDFYFTPLHLAAEEGYIDTVEYIMNTYL